MYPRGINLRDKHTFSQQVSVDKVITNELTNHLGIFADGGERKSIFDGRAIGCLVVTFGGVVTAWKAINVGRSTYKLYQLGTPNVLLGGPSSHCHATPSKLSWLTRNWPDPNL